MEIWWTAPDPLQLTFWVTVFLLNSRTTHLWSAKTANNYFQFGIWSFWNNYGEYTGNFIINSSSILGSEPDKGKCTFVASFTYNQYQLYFSLGALFVKNWPGVKAINTLNQVKFATDCNCGKSVCAQCSGKWAPLPKFSINIPTRVCNICYKKLDPEAGAGGSSSDTPSSNSDLPVEYLCSSLAKESQTPTPMSN